ncbi:MAG: PQQ-dependent sugar dehydrogenase [Ilumatobacteraceae bacterium]
MKSPASTTPASAWRWLALACAGIVALSACGSGSDSDGDSTVPTATSGGDSEPLTEPDGTAATTPADSTDDTPALTTTLAPSEEADLPTAPPQEGDEVAPATTLAGPLPTPEIRLIGIGEFAAPVGVAQHPRDGRLFVVEQDGRVIAADDESSTEVLDISDRTEGGGEQGLLGLAFHPTEDLAYVNFTDLDGDTVIAEFTVDPSSAQFDVSSQREVIAVEQPFANHNGGSLEFGPDDLLYIGLGDGGAADDPLLAGLDLSTKLGKILRIDPIAAGDAPFTVPGDNPFVDVEGADPTIWSFGLRNPWRFSFDELTGDLWIADVGQNRFEEINRAPAVDGLDAGRGLSFGWSAFEASTRFDDTQPAEGHIAPVVEYDHDDGDCSVSGGVVARRSLVENLDGWYVYGDYCSGTIWGFDTTSPPGDPVVVELGSLPELTSIGLGPEGELYAVSNAGTVARVTNE